MRAVYGSPPSPGAGRDAFAELVSDKMKKPELKLTDEALIATEQHCIAMLRYLRLPEEVRLVVDRHVAAAAVLVNEDSPGSERSERTYETAQHLAEGLRAHPSRDLHRPTEPESTRAEIGPKP